MSKVDINIVSFDVPFPPNYGGVIDVYYKLKTLSQLGLKIHLHCFDYGRGKQEDLEGLCQEITYYPRGRNPFYLCSKLPYVVITRKSRNLLRELKKNEAPILFEGLHTCYFIDHPNLKDRFKMVRMHNIEKDYYNGLAKVESNSLKRRYFELEAKKLSHFESKLNAADKIFSISNEDQKYLSTKYENTTLLPVFHSSDKLSAKTGKGEFAFYHGNLAVGENNEAALFLVNKVFNTLSHKLIIAGSGASKELAQACNELPNVELKSDIGSDEIAHHVENAHVNVLPTFQNTGIKLKMVISLFKGRFCIANDDMVLNTGLEGLTEIANSAEQWQTKVNYIFSQTFSQQDIDRREMILKSLLDNEANAKLIINAL